MTEKKKSPARPGVHFYDKDGERMKTLSAEVYYSVEGSPKAQMEFMAHFMTYKPDNKKYMTREDALAVLFQRNVGELKDLFDALRASMGESAFPND